MDSFPVPTAYCPSYYLSSRTFKDILHQIPKLSRTYSVFKYFPGPGEMDNFFKDFQKSVAALFISSNEIPGSAVDLTQKLCT